MIRRHSSGGDAHIQKECALATQGNESASRHAHFSTIAIDTRRAEARIDSRQIAQHLGVKHQSTFELLKDYRADFDQFGKLRFETRPSPSGQQEKFALLNEDQCYLLLTYSRNTAKVRALKVKLVQAFREARQARDVVQQEYLPTYHALHDGIHALAAGSEHERHVHMNFNRLLNATVGLKPGQRTGAPLPKRSLLVVAQMLAVQALAGAGSCRDAYQKAKAALKPLEGAAIAARKDSCAALKPGAGS